MNSRQISLAEAIADADLRVLLMVNFHMSGDRRWLDAPFRPQRDVRLIADEDAGFPPDVQAEIRAAAVAYLSSGAAPVITDPGDELMVEMMRACLSEMVPPEYAPMMREQIGLLETPPAAEPRSDEGLPVVIVGAGVSGIVLGARLAEQGIPYVIVERNAEVGGTWYENVYPGCAVDTPNHAYSFSFGSRYPWSRYFSPRSELQDYLERCATEFGVRPSVRFNTRLTGAAWDQEAMCWRATLETPDGAETLAARAVVSAIGQLSQVSMPTIKGADDFTGPLFHTARWPKDLDLAGKRVAIIGTGASAMQIVPEIADQVASLTIYQRSAQWARPIPHFHDAISDGAQWMLQNVDLYAAWYRFTMLWRYGDGLLPTLRIDPDWPHPERSLNKINDRHRQEMADYMMQELEGRPDLIEKCLPSYPPYGKRILLDNNWFKTLRKPNVELVTDGISQITAGGIETTDGREIAADVVIYSTGFNLAKMAARLNLVGRNGLKLADLWADGNPTAYYGVSVPEFPNLFITQGPNTGLGHGGSAIFQAECQAHYIAQSLAKMVRDGIAAIDVKQAPLDDYVQRVDAEHNQMIWSHPGMSTYYRNAQGRVYTVMPWRLVDYWNMTRAPDFENYVVTRAAGE